MKLNAVEIPEDESSNDSSVSEFGSENSWTESISTSSQELRGSQPTLQSNGVQNLPGSSSAVLQVASGNESSGSQASVIRHTRNPNSSSRSHPYNGHQRRRSLPVEDQLVSSRSSSLEHLESIANSLRQMLAVSEEINSNICRLNDNLMDVLNRLIARRETKTD